MEQAKPEIRERSALPLRYRWNLADIFPSWEAWQEAYQDLERKVDDFASRKGTLNQGAAQLLAVLRLSDEVGQLAYRVGYYAILMYDEDQRDNEVGAKRQLVYILFARAAQAGAWLSPELLEIPQNQVRQWMDENGELAAYRFHLEEIYRSQAHVLDQAGEHLLSLTSLFKGSPAEAYSALSTADMQFPEVTLSDGQRVKVTHGKYRSILSTCRNQDDRAAAWQALQGKYKDNINTYAALYNGLCQRDQFLSQARNYTSTLEAELDEDNVPLTVVENLIAATRAGVEPLRRYHRLRKEALGLPAYYLYDERIALVALDRIYPYEQAVECVVESVAPLGRRYQESMSQAFQGRWIDVYENDGKLSGAYSASVYGVHPYVLLNYSDTFDDMFTVAHEMGHSLHTVLSCEHQPFTYADYTIFVAEVASTLNEALLREYLLARSGDPAERAMLLQHAIDGISSTFYTQVLFADWELQAHRRVEQGQPLTADILNELYLSLMKIYHGDDVEQPELYGTTWARIPHFFRSPYYVYQYATCFASSARILQRLRSGSEEESRKARDLYLEMLKAGGSDHPMTLLKGAGADLEDPTTISAVVAQLDDLVDRLEGELKAL